MLRWLAMGKGLWAARWRAQGRYTRATLAAYFAAWRRWPTPANLLAWLAFRRDMGRPLPARFVPALRDGLARLAPRQQRVALGLLAEVRPDSVARVAPGCLGDAAQCMPPLAAQALTTSPLARLASQQVRWRQAFAADIAKAAAGRGVQVVGNAASLQGQGLGAAIDAAGLVVRFNQFAAGPTWLADVGQRTDVWVVSPGYHGPVPAAVRWVVVSGPDMLFRLQDWRWLLPLIELGTPVLTVPLPIWRDCVAALQAPPSAGVLALRWLHTLNTKQGWAGIRTAGIGFGAGPRQRAYHLVLQQQRPGHRHAWQAEAACLARWQAEGLCRLDAQSPLADEPPWLTASPALRQLPGLAALLGAPVRYAGPGQGVLAWGQKPSARRAQWLARWHGLPVLRLEDGFLRSFGTGDRFPPLSIVVDEVGIYYDSTRPSALENLLQSGADVLAGQEATVARARALMQRHGLSKYNHAPPLAQVDALREGQGLPPLLRPQDRQRVLVVDQTAGDLSIALGGASAQTFADMLAAALAEHPQATVYVKTHPEVSAGRKGGHYAGLGDSDRVVVLRQAIEPASLLREMDHVYVVSSTMGFEALLAGKPVTCFGLPWYAGWGATQDRQRCPRRTRTRSVDELFAAAYLHHARYLNPETLQRGTIFDVIEWLARQRREAGLLIDSPRPALRRGITVGFPRWRQYNLSPMLGVQLPALTHTATTAAAAALHPTADDALVCWSGPKPGMAELAQRSGARLVRVEDGFVRSVGLGSDLIRPRSLVLDAEGIYFDPSQPSALERLLATAHFGADELAEAARVRAFIVAHGITKYNHEPREPARWASQGRRVVLVPGQVEDDASIRLGCTTVKTNAALLQAARAACPDAFIVYKPHPDVSSGNRTGRLALAEARRWADHVESRLSVVSCIEACDELHTMTSLAGFDALLRGKRVVTHGQPFYAGWGLTDDRAVGGAALARRHRGLSLDELVAGTLLRYPIYWCWTLRGHTTCMAVLRQLQAERDALIASGGLDGLHSGWARRQARKARILLHAWLKG